MKAFLQIIEGEQAGVRIEFEPGTRIVFGRSSQADFQIRDKRCSRRHAVISFDGSELLLQDLQSANGTYVGDIPVTERALQAEDRVQMGQTVMQVIVASDASSSERPTCSMCGAPLPSGSERCPNCERVQIPGFEILDRIGKGRLGVVYLARHDWMEKKVALKVIATHEAEREKLDRFMREGKSLARLQHPSIVELYDVGRVGNEYYYMSMQYVEGPNLAQLLVREGPQAWKDVIGWGLDLLSALAYAWEDHRIIHRDIRPGNVLLPEEGPARICDFGLAKCFDPGGQSGITAPGTALGSLWYTAPEQIQDARSVDFRADVYGVAATLYHLLSGRPPYEGGSVPEVVKAIFQSPVPQLGEVRDDLPPGLASVIRKGMAKEPDDRYASHELFATDLKALR